MHFEQMCVTWMKEKTVALLAFAGIMNSPSSPDVSHALKISCWLAGLALPMTVCSPVASKAHAAVC